MKKFLALVIILILLCTCLGGCTDISPFKTVSSNAKTEKSFRVYVCGAVANEGYVTVSEGSDYNALLNAAGILPQTYLRQNPETIVTETTGVVAFAWFDGFQARSCVNVNGGYVTMRIDIDGIDPSVINKIADYIELHGKITDKTLLQEILGNDYEQNFYKFFVSVDDYEKVG